MGISHHANGLSIDHAVLQHQVARGLSFLTGLGRGFADRFRPRRPPGGRYMEGTRSRSTGKKSPTTVAGQGRSRSFSNNR